MAVTKYITKQYLEDNLKNMDKDFLEKKYLQLKDYEASTALTFKGTVEKKENLPATGNKVGDFYYVQELSSEYAWIEVTLSGVKTGKWEELGPIIEIDTEDVPIDFSKWNEPILSI